MKRILAVASATAAAAALAVSVAWTGPAAAAPGKPGTPGTPGAPAKAAHRARARPAPAVRRDPPPPVEFASEFGGGQYITLVTCSSKVTPPPVLVGPPGAPLTLIGAGPSAGALTLIKKPGPYQTVYICTLVVKKKVTVKKRLRKVVIETGFGGEASSVARHQPAG